MPIYLYGCPNCERQEEVLHSMREKPEVRCEDCSAIMVKKFSATTAIIIPTSFKTNKIKTPRWAEEKLERIKDHPEEDPYRAHRKG